MKTMHFLGALVSGALLLGAVSPCEAEEKLPPVQSALSSTTISGYVDTSAQWHSNTNAAAQGFAGLWIGIITDPGATNRIELGAVVGEAGNFAARGMNFDRTLGSDLIEGTLDRHGRVRIGQTQFHFHRTGYATVIGRSESGRFFTARLLREQIR